MITNADKVEDFKFCMIKDVDNIWYYSRSHHDYFPTGSGLYAIDGGRQYDRIIGNNPEIGYFKIKDGEFIEKE